MRKAIEKLIFPLLAFGLGFFAGERIGQKHAAQPALPVERPFGVDDETVVRTIQAENGYSPEPTVAEEKAAAEDYLRAYTHPEEDGETEPAPETVNGLMAVSIDDEEWENNPMDLEKVELYFYREDEVICDEDEKRIDDPEELLGSQTLARLEGDDVVYVHNLWNDTLYRVIAIDNAYGRVVLGIDQ